MLTLCSAREAKNVVAEVTMVHLRSMFGGLSSSLESAKFRILRNLRAVGTDAPV